MGMDFNSDQFAQFEKAMLDHEFRPAKGMYIDLVCMKDLRMGLMLSLCSNAQEKEMLREGLPKWNKRIQRKFTLAYPDWKYSEEEMQKMYLEKDRADVIFRNSPDTNFARTFYSLLNSMEIQNGRADYHLPINLCFNLYPLPLESFAHVYVNLLRFTLPKERFSIRVISCPPREVPPNVLGSVDTFVCDDFASMITEGSTMFSGYFEARKYINCMVFSSYQVADDVLKVWLEEGTDIWNPEHVKLRFEMTAMCLVYCSYFSYCHYPIPITT